MGMEKDYAAADRLQETLEECQRQLNRAMQSCKELVEALQAIADTEHSGSFTDDWEECRAIAHQALDKQRGDD